MNAAGWGVICARARAALVPLPRTTVLVGHSIGAGRPNVRCPRQGLSGTGRCQLPKNDAGKLIHQTGAGGTPSRCRTSWRGSATYGQ
jgi:hypothetical protein